MSNMPLGADRAIDREEHQVDFERCIDAATEPYKRCIEEMHQWCRGRLVDVDVVLDDIINRHGIMENLDL